jgi:hypothetical protein
MLPGSKPKGMVRCKIIQLIKFDRFSVHHSGKKIREIACILCKEENQTGFTGSSGFFCLSGRKAKNMQPTYKDTNY